MLSTNPASVGKRYPPRRLVGELRRESEMSKETAEGTTEVVVDEAAQAAAAAALAAANAEGKSGADDTKGETLEGGEAGADADEVVVTIGDTAPTQEEEEIAKAPEWVRELRKTNREQARRIRELENSSKAKEEAAQSTQLGPKPTMADPDIDYDAAKFEVALNKWNDQKRKADQELTDRQAAEKKAQDAWQARLNEYGEAKGKLKVKDFAESEAVALEALNQVQQGIVVQGAENSALVIYALGKNPAKLKELSAITDPVKFAFAVARLEKDLKLTTRKAPPPPEKVVTGSAAKSGIIDSQLERLRAEAERTGDYTKVTAYRRQKRAATS